MKRLFTYLKSTVKYNSKLQSVSFIKIVIHVFIEAAIIDYLTSLYLTFLYFTFPSLTIFMLLDNSLRAISSLDIIVLAISVTFHFRTCHFHYLPCLSPLLTKVFNYLTKQHPPVSYRKRFFLSVES